MRKLYKFHHDCGRMGDLRGVFAATAAEVKALQGQQLYFGEVLGKHSEIVIESFDTAADLRVLTGDEEFIKKAVKYGLVPSGFNPLDYVGDEYNVADAEEEGKEGSSEK